MKRSLVTTVFVFLVFCVAAQNDATQYLEAIGIHYQKIGQDMMSYVSAVNHGKSARKIEKRRQEFIEQVKESETAVRRMKPFNGTTTLRDSIAAYFRITSYILREDYGKILNLEEIAEDSYDAMEAYLLAKERAGDKGDAAFQSARRQYEAFAAENNIRLISKDDGLSLKIKEAAEVTQYADRAYLLFFKSYKNEAYLLDAMSKDNVIQLEQLGNALGSSANEDLAKAKELQAFKGDASVKTALIQALTFYKTEAEQKMKTYTDFLLAKDNFEKAKKTFEASTNRTKESVDTYNNVVADFNKKVNAANAVNDELNKKRGSMLKAWNEAYDAFLNRHTPKYR